MLNFTEEVAKKAEKGNLKPTQMKIRTKEGEVFIEQLVDGKPIRLRESKEHFIPIESAPDPEVCQIEAFLFLGSQDASVNKKELEEKQVKHILNVATGIEPAFPKEFNYCNVEILDIEEEPIIKKFDKCFDFINGAISKREGILVHCNAGVSRSATVVIAYLMKTKKLDYQTAFDFVKQKRPKINPNPGFIKQLKEYEQFVIKN